MVRGHVRVALLATFSAVAATLLVIQVATPLGVAASPPIWAAGPGLYRSDDGGARMQLVNLHVDNPDPKLQFSGVADAVAVDPQDPNKIYVVGESVGARAAIYRSADQGKTWTVKRSLLDSYPPALDGSDPNGIYDQAELRNPMQCMLCIDTANPNYWYWSFFRSTDAGETWSRMFEPRVRSGLWGLAPDRGVSGLVYAAIGGDMRVSHDYGATWSTTPLFAHSGFVFVDPTTGYVYDGWARSTDGGQTFARLSIEGGVNSVAFDPNGDMYFDGVGLFKSSDKGDTFHLQSPGSFDINRELVADPNASGHLFRFDRRQPYGVYARSTDAGQTFSAANPGPPRPCILRLTPAQPDCNNAQIQGGVLMDLAFTAPPPPQRQSAPVVAAPQAAPAAEAAPAPAASVPAVSALRLVRLSDGGLYFVLLSRGWAMVPDPIEADELAGYAIAGQWLTIDVSQIQPGTVHLVVAADGTVYMLQGSGGWSLLVNALSDAEAAALQRGPQVGAQVPVEFLVSPASFAETTVAAPADTGGPPAELTDHVRQDIVNAINSYNAAWQQAQASADASALGNAAAGQELADDVAAVDQLRAQGQTRKLVQSAFNVSDAALDAPGHAIVHTTETWGGELDSLRTGQLLQRLPQTGYAETYTVEFQNGRWIVTLDELQPR